MGWVEGREMLSPILMDGYPILFRTHLYNSINNIHAYIICIIYCIWTHSNGIIQFNMKKGWKKTKGKEKDKGKLQLSIVNYSINGCKQTFYKRSHFVNVNFNEKYTFYSNCFELQWIILMLLFFCSLLFFSAFRYQFCPDHRHHHHHCVRTCWALLFIFVFSCCCHFFFVPHTRAHTWIGLQESVSTCRLSYVWRFAHIFIAWSAIIEPNHSRYISGGTEISSKH